MASHDVLGITFKCARVVQTLCMIPIIGIVANFISQIISSNQVAPQVLTGTLSITCIAMLYTIITTILYLENMLPLHVTSILDLLFLIAYITISVVIGQPLTYLNCIAIGSSSGSTIFEFTSSLGSDPSTTGGPVNFNAWIGASRDTCLEMKSVWGLSISLCILFAFSIMSTFCLWRRKTVAAPAKSVEV